jgi:hypothetical protein
MTTRANHETQSSELPSELVEFNNLAKEAAIEERLSDAHHDQRAKFDECASCQNTFCLRKTAAPLSDRPYLIHSGGPL